MSRSKLLKIITLLISIVISLSLVLYLHIASESASFENDYLKRHHSNQNYHNHHNYHNLHNLTVLKHKSYINKIRTGKQTHFTLSVVTLTVPTNRGEMEENQCKIFYKDVLFQKQKILMTWKDVVNRTKLCNATKHANEFRLIRRTFGLGLGNLMFVYASSKSIALKSNRTFVYQYRDRLFDVFNLENRAKHRPIDEDNTLEAIFHIAAKYNEAVYRLPAEDVILSGFLQSWRFFDENLVKREFQFKHTILQASSTFIQKVRNSLAKTTKLIGIHVRRGDMLLTQNADFGHVVADRDYFKRAMQYFKEKYECHFIVASNDIQWCKNNLQTYTSRITYSEINSSEVDMAILTRCDHLIISVGTFGWWAAYLSKGDVVYYRNWPRNGSTFAKVVNKRDYFLPYWIPL